LLCMLTCSCCHKLQFEFNSKIEKIARKLISEAKKASMAEKERREER